MAYFNRYVPKAIPYLQSKPTIASFSRLMKIWLNCKLRAALAVIALWVKLFACLYRICAGLEHIKRICLLAWCELSGRFRFTVRSKSIKHSPAYTVPCRHIYSCPVVGLFKQTCWKITASKTPSKQTYNHFALLPGMTFLCSRENNSDQTLGFSK